MPFITRSRLDGLLADRDEYLLRAENAEQEAKEQTAAAVLLARRELEREDTLASARAALTAPYEQVKAENEQLRKTVDQLKRRLDDALGYTPEQQAAIESGRGEPIRRPTSN
jgi:phage shock protein A